MEQYFYLLFFKALIYGLASLVGRSAVVMCVCAIVSEAQFVSACTQPVSQHSQNHNNGSNTQAMIIMR